MLKKKEKSFSVMAKKKDKVLRCIRGGDTLSRVCVVNEKTNVSQRPPPTNRSVNMTQIFVTIKS